MAQNIEIKAYATDFDTQLILGEKLADGPAAKLVQTDTFFNCAEGRLKLREFPDTNAQLIYYHRKNQSGPKLSEYHISETPNAAELKYTLRQTLGELAMVQKTRTLLMSGRTRLHFDRVEGLGNFIELEVVLESGEHLDQGKKEAHALMDKLNIKVDDLIERAYVDLLAEAQS